MGASKRKTYTPEYRREASRLVIDTGRTVAAVAREIGVGEQLLGRVHADTRGPEAGCDRGDQSCRARQAVTAQHARRTATKKVARGIGIVVLEVVRKARRSGVAERTSRDHEQSGHSVGSSSRRTRWVDSSARAGQRELRINPECMSLVRSRIRRRTARVRAAVAPAVHGVRRRVPRLCGSSG